MAEPDKVPLTLKILDVRPESHLLVGMRVTNGVSEGLQTFMTLADAKQLRYDLGVAIREIAGRDPDGSDGILAEAMET